MDSRWRILVRVRELRARVASNEASQRRRASARAELALDQATRLQARYEAQAAHASALASIAEPGRTGEEQLNAWQAQQMLSYAAGARLKAQQSAAPVRRAQLVCERAIAAAEEAGLAARRANTRRETILSTLRARQRTAKRRQLEREQEALMEERIGGTRTHTTEDDDAAREW
jgi:hypothetical protein